MPGELQPGQFRSDGERPVIAGYVELAFRTAYRQLEIRIKGLKTLSAFRPRRRMQRSSGHGRPMPTAVKSAIARDGRDEADTGVSCREWLFGVFAL